MAFSTRRSRAIRGLGLDLDPDEVVALLAENDAVRQRFGWTTEAEVPLAVLDRLRTTRVSDEDLHGWFVEHADLFGGRTFTESRGAVERLVRIEKVRAELGGRP